MTNDAIHQDYRDNESVALKRWAGNRGQYGSKLQVALAFEGLTKAKLLRDSGWGTLKDYVDANETLCNNGERDLPVGIKNHCLADGSGAGQIRSIEVEIRNQERAKKSAKSNFDRDLIQGRIDRLKKILASHRGRS